MTSLIAVGRAAACAGFALAGLRTEEAADAAEGAVRVMALAADPEAGVVLVEQEIFDAIPELDRRTLARRATPILVPFPGPLWDAQPPPADAFVLNLLQRAIGYRVRLR